MRNYLYIGLGFAALLLAGWLYYIHPSHVHPAPKNLTLVFPKPLLEKATKAQLAVLRGEATSASKASDAAAAPPAAPAAAEGQPALLADPAGLQVTLTTDQQNSLRGQASNVSAQPVVYARPAGTLFSNGEGDVVLLKDVSVEVPPKGKVPLSLPVAQTTVGTRMLEGRFTPRAGAVSDALRPLVELLAHKQNVSPAVAQTAVLIVNDDAPLDMIASFPRLQPPALVNTADERPFSVSPADLIASLRLIQEAGLDPAKSALMSEPQLKVMTLLDPESHAAAMEFYGLSDQTEWSYWKKQLLDGDPALRHYAFYGIARYYPAVALDMLPRWVRDPGVYRSYRLSAAWALALVDDARAPQTLQGLRQEFQADAGLRQTLDRALQHWGADNSHPDGHAGKTAGTEGDPARPGHAS